MSNVALLIAGGSGNRMHQDIPKQFITVNERPVIVYTLEAFENHPEIDCIAVVLTFEFTSAFRLLALLIYWYSWNCSVNSSSFVISSRVSWNEFHWLTAAKIAIVARMGLMTGSMMEKKMRSVPAPSISPASCNSCGTLSQ